MKKLFWLILVAAIAYGGYKIWNGDDNAIAEFFGKENIDEARQRVKNAVGERTKENAEDSLRGEWVAAGPAVYLNTGNAIGNVGSSAVAKIAESKLKPYYKRLELQTTKINFTDNLHFVITVHDVPLNGTLEKRKDSGYNLVLSSQQISIPEEYCRQLAFIQADAEQLTLTFDVKKLVSLVAAIADEADNAVFSMAVQLTQSYDNVCLGFHFKRR